MVLVASSELLAAKAVVEEVDFMEVQEAHPLVEQEAVQEEEGADVVD